MYETVFKAFRGKNSLKIKEYDFVYAGEILTKREEKTKKVKDII